MAPLRRIVDILVCPACKGRLEPAPEALACAGCRRIYPVVEGVPLLTLFSPGAGTGGAAAGRSTRDYEERYQDIDRARRYNEKYARQPLKRLSTWRERAILGRLLARGGPCETLLEVPCGGGRLSAVLAPAAGLLIQADIGLGQVLLARSSAGGGKTGSPPPAEARGDRKGAAFPQTGGHGEAPGNAGSGPETPLVDGRTGAGRPSRIWISASALRLPFADRGVDAAVCIRLAHHLRDQAEREALLVELLRVARRYVIVTFFDHHAVKNRLRLARGKRSKLTMTAAQVARLAEAAGAAMIACPRLSWWGSGHRYALLARAPSA
jgi:hypothetical protein